jgi:putative sporulation protein YtxC
MGGTWLVTIAFSNPSDGIAVLKNMIQVAKKHKINPSFAKLSETSSKNLELHIHEDKKFILDVLTAFTRNKVEDICLKEMIEHAFLYSDASEQKEIFSISKSIILGEIEGIPEVKGLPCLNELISVQWENLFHSSVSFIEFEAFLKFRLRDYLATLLKLVECAIDEFKMEMEYQLFIDQLRNCINRQRPFSNRKVVVIFDIDDIVIVDERNHTFTQTEITVFYEKALKLTNASNLDERLLGPLIGLCPMFAHIYTYDVDHPLLQTIKNVFQETVVIAPIETMTKKSKRLFKKKS